MSGPLDCSVSTDRLFHSMDVALFDQNLLCGLWHKSVHRESIYVVELFFPFYTVFFDFQLCMSSSISGSGSFVFVNDCGRRATNSRWDWPYLQCNLMSLQISANSLGDLSPDSPGFPLGNVYLGPDCRTQATQRWCQRLGRSYGEPIPTVCRWQDC